MLALSEDSPGSQRYKAEMKKANQLCGGLDWRASKTYILPHRGLPGRGPDFTAGSLWAVDLYRDGLLPRKSVYGDA